MKGDKSNPHSYAVLFRFLFGFITLAFSFIHGFQFPPFNHNLLFFVISAALWAGSTVFLFKSLQFLESSEVTILTSVRSLVTISASIIFLHELFSLKNAVGTIIILASILLVSNLKKGIVLNKGVIYAFSMAVFSGLALVFDAFNLKNHYDPISYIAIINFMMAGILLAVYPRVLKEWKVFIKPPFLKKMIPLGIFGSTQAIAYYFAIEKGPAALIASINQAQVIVTVVLAFFLLHEKDNVTKKIIAAVLVAFGVILLRA